FVAGIGITNTLVTSVVERTGEIGILRAVGATRAQIMGFFLAEGAFIGLLGSALGLGLARGLAVPADGGGRRVGRPGGEGGGGVAGVVVVAGGLGGGGGLCGVVGAARPRLPPRPPRRPHPPDRGTTVRVTVVRRMGATSPPLRTATVAFRPSWLRCRLSRTL